MGLYRPDKSDKQTQLSSLVINGFLTLNGTFGIGIQNKTFLNEDSLRLYIDGKAHHSVESYYGIGDDTNRNDGNAFDYNKDQFEIEPTLLKKFAKNSFFGPLIHLNYTNGNDVQPSANLVTPNTLQTTDFPNSSTIVGIGLRAFHDSRDFVLNATTGRFIDLSFTQYDDAIGSKADFSKAAFEWSEYFSLDKEKYNILAFQIKSETNNGDIPWDQYALVGGSNGLRGYYEGRYRDSTMVLTQIEWRKEIRKPHGIAVWVGGAMMGKSYSDLSDSRVLKSIGTGYRLQVKEGVNVRFDYGIADGESGFYMNIAEAF
ncbi:BamA/TamA family outer membrane protein [Halobacteriovorax sp. HLS]|uniref:BamA/TamA family outer membrane protein n=1 Tax=Halobacteriovorax sp. HLS TaxID=2234000 RepID=UPI0013E2EAFB|nr:BamA/TamA family outer membrane protein [Halobacteriovorax sp. HLS]